MIALSLLLAAPPQVAAPPQAAPSAAASSAPAPAAAPPADWSALPPLRFRRAPELPAGMGEFAQRELAAGRCAGLRGRPVRVEMAVLVSAAGVQRVVPRAIGCATIEQYASGLVSRFARDNLEGGDDAGWYVAVVNFPAAPAPAPAAPLPAAPARPQ